VKPVNLFSYELIICILWYLFHTSILYRTLFQMWYQIKNLKYCVCGKEIIWVTNSTQFPYNSFVEFFNGILFPSGYKSIFTASYHACKKELFDSEWSFN
jgi:hypothetical protein